MNTIHTTSSSSRDSLLWNTKDFAIVWTLDAFGSIFELQCNWWSKGGRCSCGSNFDYSCNLSIMPPTYPTWFLRRMSPPFSLITNHMLPKCKRKFKMKTSMPKQKWIAPTNTFIYEGTKQKVQQNWQPIECCGCNPYFIH